MSSEHPFGEVVAGEAVKPTHFDPTAGYRPRGRYVLKTYGTGYARLDPDDVSRKADTMTTTALATVDSAASALTVTADQLDLVKRTVANGATDAELKLYLYDCQRQGVHPLDRLLHYTKRGGKYTPVTSIDLMRIRAAETGEYAGSDDATFVMLNVRENEAPVSATVTVWRLVQGQRVPFTATARWSEYFPGDAGGHMWKKMPHTMLAKCAEALALRKGFPRQLAGLYAKEEMDQADGGSHGRVAELEDAPVTSRTAVREVVRTGGATRAGSTPAPVKSDDGPDLGTAEPDNLPEGYRLIDHYEFDTGGWHHVSWGRDAQGGWMTYKTKLAKIGEAAKDAYENREPVRIVSKKFPFLDKVESLGVSVKQIADSKFNPDDDCFCDECNRPNEDCICG